MNLILYTPDFWGRIQSEKVKKVLRLLAETDDWVTDRQIQELTGLDNVHLSGTLRGVSMAGQKQGLKKNQIWQLETIRQNGQRIRRYKMNRPMRELVLARLKTFNPLTD